MPLPPSGFLHLSFKILPKLPWLVVLRSVLSPSSLPAELAELSLWHQTDYSTPLLEYFQGIPLHDRDKAPLLGRCPSPTPASSPALSLSTYTPLRTTQGAQLYTVLSGLSVSARSSLCLENCSHLLYLQSPVRPLGSAQTSLECGTCLDHFLTPSPEFVTHCLYSHGTLCPGHQNNMRWAVFVCAGIPGLTVWASISDWPDIETKFCSLLCGLGNDSES